MTKQALDGEDVRVGRHSQARRSVAQLMRGEALLTDRISRASSNQSRRALRYEALRAGEQPLVMARVSIALCREVSSSPSAILHDKRADAQRGKATSVSSTQLSTAPTPDISVTV